MLLQSQPKLSEQKAMVMTRGEKNEVEKSLEQTYTGKNGGSNNFNYGEKYKL